MSHVQVSRSQVPDPRAQVPGPRFPPRFQGQVAAGLDPRSHIPPHTSHFTPYISRHQTARRRLQLGRDSSEPGRHTRQLGGDSSQQSNERLIHGSPFFIASCSKSLWKSAVARRSTCFAHAGSPIPKPLYQAAKLQREHCVCLKPKVCMWSLECHSVYYNCGCGCVARPPATFCHSLSRSHGFVAASGTMLACRSLFKVLWGR